MSAPRRRLRDVLLGGIAALLVAGLLAMLAVGVTMLVRMAVERDAEPDFHLPTFVVVCLALAALAGRLLTQGRRRAGRRGPSLSGARATRLFAGTITLVVGDDGGTPVADYVYADASSAEGLAEPIVVADLTARDLTLLQRTMNATAAADPDGESAAGQGRMPLALSRIDSLLTGSDALAGPLRRVMVRIEADVAAGEGTEPRPEGVLGWAARRTPGGGAGLVPGSDAAG